MIKRWDPTGPSYGEGFGVCSFYEGLFDLPRGTLGAFMEGAAETTTTFFRTMILMLVAFPEVQAKAQQEIDTVVGVDRAPLPSDFEQMPYVQAIVKEVS